MNIQEYVKQNYETLPKSTFNDDECVIIKENTNSNEGYGHHYYEGIGVDQNGSVLWCFSSGCSCNGSCGMDHRDSTKVLEAGFDLSDIDPETVNFDGIAVSFSDY